jgi:hypothetical protein
MKKFYEKDLEEIIYNASDEQLSNAGLCTWGSKRFRQLRIGNYGIADLVMAVRAKTVFSNESFLQITIYELKQEKVGVGAFLQSIGYAKGIQRYLKKRGISDYIINIILIGSEIDITGNLCFIPSLFFTDNDMNANFEYINNISFLTYNYEFDGISFKSDHDFKLTNEGF